MSVTPQDKTFLLGVGAQKCGTTWLYDYLDSHPAAKMGFIKEYHIFDGIHIPECGVFYERARDRVAQINRIKQPEKYEQAKLWLSFYEDTENYFEFFLKLSKSDPMTQLVGDISPSYSGLSPDIFRTIRSNLIERGFRVRVVFLMRDPVERLWSAVRMGRRKTKRQPSNPGLVFKQTEAQQIMKVATQPKFELRGRYDRTIAALQEVFEPEELYFALYEEMFTPASAQALTTFLNIPHVTPDFDQISNASPKKEALSDDAQAFVVDHYKDTYLATARLSGAEKLRELWPSFHLYEHRHETGPM
jgi:hypothetical protein